VDRLEPPPVPHARVRPVASGHRAGDFAGDCGLTPQVVDGVTELEVGYHVVPALQGRGYATEAAAACRDYARTALGASRLIAIIHPDNRPSQRVAEKIGLRPEKRSLVTAAGRRSSTPARCR
jgi:Acetyltransferases, including N-acetylases of ribosomal proteins